ncbi:bifunctional 2-polyprenyl-6-hydroxyphenol methylase/3-demethylubiquinol 3-O-methyltransferase UbiG [Nocardia sp. NBC_00511]|uniref:bifunctional 2-polyprenyl-6-hydroxyphenol methylase/3-demethylubiquinol 3-O-methyltransferase UbiG n=1 Tax=Nocardia sp. NBC_00511 TaxID=2903591 RepID=UPI0030E1FA96
MKQSQTESDFFGDFAESWWDDDSAMKGLVSFQRPRFEYFDQFVTDWSGKKVLDVGCGGGFTTEYLDGRGAVVSGMDPSPRLVAAAGAHAEATGKAITYSVGRAEALPYEDHSFDVVTCVDVLEHVDNPALAVSEIARVLKPGGIFCYDTINRTLLARLVMIWIPEYLTGMVARGTHHHHQFIKPAELAAHLEAAGLKPLAKQRGLTILGKKRDGNLIMFTTRDLSSTYIGAAVRS